MINQSYLLLEISSHCKNNHTLKQGKDTNFCRSVIIFHCQYYFHLFLIDLMDNWQNDRQTQYTKNNKNGWNWINNISIFKYIQQQKKHQKAMQTQYSSMHDQKNVLTLCKWVPNTEFEIAQAYAPRACFIILTTKHRLHRKRIQWTYLSPCQVKSMIIIVVQYGAHC